MRITLKLVIALIVSATAVATLTTYAQIHTERAMLIEDLDLRSEILSESLQHIVEPILQSKKSKGLKREVRKFKRREHLVGIAVCDPEGKLLAGAGTLTGDLSNLQEDIRKSFGQGLSTVGLKTLGADERHIFILPLRSDEDDEIIGGLILSHDASFITARLKELWRRNFFGLLLNALLIALVSLWIIRWSVTTPVARLADWMKQLRSGNAAETPPPPEGLLEPLAVEATHLAKNLSAARAAAEEEAYLRQKAESVWTSERLKEHVKAKLDGRPLIVVANREPYMHNTRGKKIEVLTPASGLVTGVEPVLLACGGLWVAHGAGSADRETVDANDKLKVPPDDPKYELRRVWLGKEEEEGYYFGFSNEGLWPLCHIAHTRPVFKADDWKHYQAVNRKFADAVVEEMKGMDEPCILIQDYHFALLPAMIKERRPDARVAIFWHIPWPNPEAFLICPWQRDILKGMLGADLIGFHIQFHCNNFLETVDHSLESRIDWERFAVQREGHTTLVKPFPISIAFPSTTVIPDPLPDKDALLKEHGLKARFMGIGVDRLDYTKGILERFYAVEQFLEKYPSYQGQFTLVQIGAPSRTHIKRYRDLITEIESEADRINWRFQSKDYKPILMLTRHHSHTEIAPYYKAADVCLVTALHDGMNLVAKEYVAMRDDEKGALILSRFTGTAREFRDALIVNPYDAEQVSGAIRYALEMGLDEQNRRMVGMRQSLKENNIYAWAASLIEDLSKLRMSPVKGATIRT